MLKKFLLLAAFFLTIAVISCKKNKDATPVNTGSVSSPGCKLLTLIVNPDSTNKKQVWNFTYNNDGKLTRVASDSTYATYEYGLNAVYIKVFNSSNHLLYSISYTIGAQGYPISDSEGSTYEYNPDGFLTKYVRLNGTYTYTATFSYTNGNRTSKVLISQHSGISDTTTYVYALTDKINPFTGQYFSIYQGIYDDEIASPFPYIALGKASKNIPKGYTSSGTNMLTGVFTHTSTFDADGRLSSDISEWQISDSQGTKIGGGVPYKTTYAFKCN